MTSHRATEAEMTIIMASKASPCPFCGARLVAEDDHHGSWIGHPSNGCIIDHMQIMDGEDLDGWNKRAVEERK